MLTSSGPVKVWDTVGEDKVLKGEYKVLAGKVYVDLICVSYEDERDGDYPRSLATISIGTERARELLPSAKVATSQ